ncbi:MAG: hypothetical protein ACTSUX_09955 [Promethearchaeota archaeon]
MHINSHFAVGMIFASILNYFYNFSIFEFMLIVIFSFICDFDVFLSKYAKNGNHRMLISHSVLPSILIIIVGIIFSFQVLVFGGIAYAIHIIIDSLDWGTNFFYFNKKPVGPKLLISKEELRNLDSCLSKYKVKASFFDEKYYKNKICLIVELLLFILMMIFVLIFALQYAFFIIIYFLGLYFHLSRHFYLKKIERGSK